MNKPLAVIVLIIWIGAFVQAVIPTFEYLTMSHEMNIGNYVEVYSKCTEAYHNATLHMVIFMATNMFCFLMSPIIFRIKGRG